MSNILRMSNFHLFVLYNSAFNTFHFHFICISCVYNASFPFPLSLRFICVLCIISTFIFSVFYLYLMHHFHFHFFGILLCLMHHFHFLCILCMSYASFPRQASDCTSKLNISLSNNPAVLSAPRIEE